MLLIPFPLEEPAPYACVAVQGRVPPHLAWCRKESIGVDGRLSKFSKNYLTHFSHGSLASAAALAKRWREIGISLAST